ncbi:hypothetical protein N7495_005827 [Penicillium taxi]|uniref:uncharacterized protein n=1 Tax=Penicillium taxi TaxID=168475 RepID=UPI002544F12C|nr:uncharacterized protein N7495_005827 [Penicillium taxi]KAJ5894136.1 hypothetical protein N7495_005827 [Penicillium taxi]
MPTAAPYTFTRNYLTSVNIKVEKCNLTSGKTAGWRGREGIGPGTRVYLTSITQAAAYIANRLPLVTVSTYLQFFHESKSKRTRLLQTEDSADLQRDSSIRYAVITTWQQLFEQIRHERPAATDLLALMSMFDRQGIPEDLVRDYTQNILGFHDTLAPLLSYSLFRLEMNEKLFNMRRPVQLSVRAVLNSIYDEDDEEGLNAATLLSNYGWFLDLQGTYKEAESMHRWALEAQEKVLGREHPDTITSVVTLAMCLIGNGI